MSAAAPDPRSATAEAPDLTPLALRHLALAALTMVLLAMATYLLPGLSRFRPWIAGEQVPIVRMFVGEGADLSLPTFAEAGGGADRIEQSLGAEVAASLADVESGVTGQSGDAQTPARSAGPAVRIAPSEYEGVTQQLEGAHQLSNFFAALERSARKQSGAITRVAHYGDSAVAADQITRTLRRRLQVRFGDSGHGYMLIARGDMHYGHRDIKHRSSDGWLMQSLVRSRLNDGWYGYGGVRGQATGGAHSFFGTIKKGPIGTHVKRFEVHYQRHRKGARMWLSVDKKTVRKINTRQKEKEDAWERIELPTDGKHSLGVKIRGAGQSHIYGVVFERDVPGVVYDSLGLVGARAQRLLNANPEHMQRQIAHRAPNLLVLAFGGNEAGNQWLDLDRYERELISVVQAMRRGRSDMDCVLFGPLDQGEIDKRGNIVTMDVLPKIVEVQRRVARGQRCAFYDTFSAMGGEHSVRKWYNSKPRLVSSDYRHATPRGYHVIGNMYYKALLRAFAEYLKKK